jgi:hypothetical protein
MKIFTFNLIYLIDKIDFYGNIKYKMNKKKDLCLFNTIFNQLLDAYMEMIYFIL